MPKNKLKPLEAPTSTSDASTSSSSAISGASSQTLFKPTVLDLPNDLLEMIASYLENKDLIASAQTSRNAYRTYYPTLKAAMVKVLKELGDRDDTVRMKKLLKMNANLQLRKDPLDPDGIAYQGIETSAYQDTLSDPFSKERRDLLEESFPGKTEKEKLEHAALEAEELKRKPLFNQLQKEKHKIMTDTKFAYETYIRKYDAWAAADNNNDDDIQDVRDAWMRVDLVQNQWSKRLRKIFSWVNMDESQTFEGLPSDLQDPCFYNDLNDPWLPGTIKGCDLRLMSVPAEQDLDAADFRATLRTTADGSPVLICQGKGKEATYHIYAPYIPLDRDESEWRVVPIDDPAVIELIKWGRPPPYSEVAAAVDFNQEVFPYTPVFGDLYRFGSQHSLHLGSGVSSISAVYNYGGVRARAGLAEGVGCEEVAANFAAVSALYEKRRKHLATHLGDLERYLPGQKEPPRLAPGLK